MAGPIRIQRCTALHLPAAQLQFQPCLVWPKRFGGPIHLVDTDTAQAALALGKQGKQSVQDGANLESGGLVTSHLQQMAALHRDLHHLLAQVFVQLLFSAAAACID